MDFCVCCGEYVPEGTMVCQSCWKRYMEDECVEDEESIQLERYISREKDSE